MASDLSLIKKIQAADVRIAELEQELSALPKQVAAIEQKLRESEAKLAQLKQFLAESDTLRRKLEGDATLWNEKADRVQEQLTQATTNEQYRAFRNEIAFARKEVKRLEDQVLEQLEAAEELKTQIEQGEQALETEREEVAKEVEETKARFSGDQKALAEAQAARAELAKGVDRKLLSVYERARRKLGPAAVAEARNERCSSCNMAIRPRLTQLLRQSDQLVQCEVCGAILHLPEPETPVEDPAGEAGVV